MEIKKFSLAILLIFLIVFQIAAVSALSASQAKENWQDAKQETQEIKLIHNEAKSKWQGNKSDENVQGYIDTGKDLLNAALDEADAWLIWKQEEADDENNLPAELKNQIESDIESNRAKIEELRGKVEAAETKGQVDLVALGMVLSYLELLTDVARDSGKIWTFKSNEYVNKIEEYEMKLRNEAENHDNSEEVIAKLDEAKSSMNEAKENINKAELSYGQVVAGGTPLIKFNEGNQYLRTAKTNMIIANNNLRLALRLMVNN